MEDILRGEATIKACWEFSSVGISPVMMSLLGGAVQVCGTATTLLIFCNVDECLCSTTPLAACKRAFERRFFWAFSFCARLRIFALMGAALAVVGESRRLFTV